MKNHLLLTVRKTAPTNLKSVVSTEQTKRELYTTKELSLLIKMSVEWIQDAVGRGELHPIYISKRDWLWDYDSVVAELKVR